MPVNTEFTSVSMWLHNISLIAYHNSVCHLSSLSLLVCVFFAVQLKSIVCFRPAYQLEMMKQLRVMNVDANTVGWYQSCYLGTFFDQSFVDAQYTYQKHIPNSVVVVYDPFQTKKGKLVIKAYRLTDEFMKLYNTMTEGKGNNKFNHDAFAKSDLDSSDIFEQIPIKIHNSHLIHAFLYEIREEKNWACNNERLGLAHSHGVEKNMQVLSQCIDSYSK